MKVNVINETTQEFNGKRYYLCGRYFQRGRHLHVVVWEHHNGKRPAGYHVHHVDENKSNNQIENLELRTQHDHFSYHVKKQWADGTRSFTPEKIADFVKKSSEWHGSTDGRESARQAMKSAQKVLLSKSEAVCEICGKTYQVTRINASRTRYCSKNCKAAGWRANSNSRETRTCPVCKSEFTAQKASDTLCCSKKCAWVVRHESKINQTSG